MPGPRNATSGSCVFRLRPCLGFWVRPWLRAWRSPAPIRISFRGPTWLYCSRPRIRPTAPGRAIASPQSKPRPERWPPPAAKQPSNRQGADRRRRLFSGFRIARSRKISSYVARLGDIVVVTNSLAQLTQLVKVHAGKLPAIAGLPEYSFFRTRYVRGAAEESALVFLSDATIRRWCGPRWRIASSRRVCDQALMSELQATYLDDLVHGHVEAGPIHTDLAAIDAGNLRLTAAGVTSSVLGSLDFQTPIIEIPLEKVTQQEADFYKQWRDTYQQNWRWGFDPIALRITADDKHLGADLTVMPLILNTEYRQFLSFTQGAEIKPGAGDPHDALVHWIVAFNREAPEVRQASNMVESMMSGATSPLSWIGSSIGVYADDDPFWEELAKQPDDAAREKFFEQNFARLPVAINIEVASPLKATAFIVALRGMVEQTAPGMVVWESKTYHEQAYVKISPTEKAKGELPAGAKEPALYYAITSDALIVTLSEPLLKSGRSTARRSVTSRSPRSSISLRAGKTLARFKRLPAIRQSGARHVRQSIARRLRKRTAAARLEQSADPQRIQAALSRSRSGRDLRKILPDTADLPRRRQVRLERRVADDGIDALRPSRPTEKRPRRAIPLEQLQRSEFRLDV